MKRIQLVLLCCLVLAACNRYEPIDYSPYQDKLNIYLVNDMGRNGYYDQKPLAELMGEMAEEVDPECVAALGDVRHFYGVASVSDPLWLTNYEHIYSHPDLMLPWYPVLGNHEYRGNTQAVLDYAGVSRRWMMPARYYTKVFEEDGFSLRLVWLDTTPLISKYRSDDKYADAALQNDTLQLAWADSVLASSREDWVVVMGHHPVYAHTYKEESERADLQQRLDPILRRHHVDMYVCGHIHNFQHLRVDGSDLDYVVNSAASLSRVPEAVEGTVFCSAEPGFSILSADSLTLTLRMIDGHGRVLHAVERRH